MENKVKEQELKRHLAEQEASQLKAKFYQLINQV